MGIQQQPARVSGPRDFSTIDLLGAFLTVKDAFKVAGLKWMAEDFWERDRGRNHQQGALAGRSCGRQGTRSCRRRSCGKLLQGTRVENFCGALLCDTLVGDGLMRHSCSTPVGHS